MLEAKLAVVNEDPALRQPWKTPRSHVGKGARLEQTEERVGRNQHERAKREAERSRLERMSRLFRVANPKKTWTRVSVLSFGKVISLVAGFK